MEDAMQALTSRADLAQLAESIDLECKLAAGSDGRGRLPKEFWPTYSAFANTRGGMIVLGLKEKDRRFELHGVEQADRLVEDLFNAANNPQKVSCNLLTDTRVRQLNIEGRTLVAVEVPAAGRKLRPVYLNGNPFNGNTYRRLHSGDRHCDDETVKRMLAEQLDDERDRRILVGFTPADLDVESLAAYRNLLRIEKPNHPWAALGDADFLRALGAWREDRASGEQGLSLAGLLMFGQWPAIQEAAPNYFLDYQERPADPNAEARWLDRIVPDGSWSGNLFDFYRRVSRKLTEDLKVPFVLKGNVRQDDTALHQALREALVNALVHADYSGRASVLIVKRPTGFLFRNPGLLRVPAALALQGGESDCRNRTIQQLFLMIGIGERAGSGVPKILHGWQGEGREVTLSDAFEPYEQTHLELLWGVQHPAEGSPTVADKLSGKMSGKMSGKRAQEIVDLIRQQPEATIPELAAQLNVTSRTIERYLKKLQDEQRLRRVGSPKGGYWEVLVPEVPQ